MDVKDLNKSQLILLAILLSFVVSIATGITTVTLMQQAPQSVTAPINHVVQQTVEKIQQVEGKTNTVVVKEEDLVVDAIAKNQPAIFTITKEVFDSSTPSGIAEVPAGRGFAVSNSDIVVADALLVPGQETYYVKNNGGKFKTTFVTKDPGGFSLLKIGDPVDGKSKLVYTAPVFGDITTMKAGQKIIVFGSDINSFIFDGNPDIKISDVGKTNGGGMVLDLDGNVIGIALSGDPVSFAPMSTIKTALNKINPPASASVLPATQ